MTKVAKRKELLVIGGSTLIRAIDGAWITKTPVADYLNELSAIFDSVTWATSTYKGEAALGGKLNKNIKIIPLRTGKIRILVNSAKLLSKVGRRKTYVLVYFPAALLVLFAIPLLLPRSKRFVTYLAGDYRVTAKTNLDKKGRLWRLFFVGTIESLLKWSDAVIARGKYLHKVAKQYNETVFETVPIAHLPDQRINHKEFGEAGAKRVIYIGKLLETKGVALLLESFRNLASMNNEKNLFLDIVGEGNLRKYIEQYIKKESLQNSVILHGWVDQKDKLDRLIREADVLVVPSTSKQPEGVPRVIEEALMRGTPVISTTAGGIKGEFTCEQIYLVNPDSTEALQIAISKMLFDKSTWNQYKTYSDTRFNQWEKFGTAAQQHSEIILRGKASNEI